MSPVSQAFAEFDASYSAMLQAASRVRSALQAEAGLRPSPCELILHVVARHLGVEPGAILSRDRRAEVAHARHASMWLCRQLTPRSLGAIGQVFSRDHGTVMLALRRVRDRAATEPQFAAELLELRRRCEEALGK